MNEHDASSADKVVDPRIKKDWEDVQARRADISSRDGGDTRRQAILKRLGILKRAS
jgi:hypothetical protein